MLTEEVIILGVLWLLILENFIGVDKLSYHITESLGEEEISKKSQNKPTEL